IRLHFGPNVEVHETVEPGIMRLALGKVEVTIGATKGAWSKENYVFSAGYGVSRQTVAAVLQTNASRFEWSLAIEGLSLAI
ncbi:MAG: hypothetical protein AB1664_20310, partial [Thermodesulfobacteriota bacterium]